MSKYKLIDEAVNLQNSNALFNNITAGLVVDTNDPQQMGRLRILCPALGDTEDKKIGEIPWAMYCAPFGGVDDLGTRGRGEDLTSGPVAYGMWNIPKVGAQALVACIDGNPSLRIWFGCLYGQYLTHTMPHGRFTYKSDNAPDGPLSSSEQPIQPLYRNLTEAFTNRENFEFRTRGADISVSFLDDQSVNTPESQVSKVSDDREESFVEPDGHEILHSQGYGVSRHEPDLGYDTTGKNYDSQTYGHTTPGNHSVSMCDRADNCRIRIRTTHGMQIILDDTNERIYVSTARGKSWIELDEQGMIDIYGSEALSFRSKDINFTADGTIRMAAKQGFHITSDGEIRMHSGTDFHLRSDAAIRSHATTSLFLQADSELHCKAGSLLAVESGASVTVLAGSTLVFSGTNGSLDAGGIFAGTDFQTSSIGLVGHEHTYLSGTSGPGGPTQTTAHIGGGGSVASAPPADDSNEVAAFFTNRIPSHEPFARMYIDMSVADVDGDTLTFPGNGDFEQYGEYSYDDPKVGRGSDQRNISLDRNPLWHR